MGLKFEYDTEQFKEIALGISTTTLSTMMSELKKHRFEKDKADFAIVSILVGALISHFKDSLLNHLPLEEKPEALLVETQLISELFFHGCLRLSPDLLTFMKQCVSLPTSKTQH